MLMYGWLPVGMMPGMFIMVDAYEFAVVSTLHVLRNPVCRMLLFVSFQT